MVSHPLINKIGFTGSTPVGKRIQVKAAETCKRVTLELGGKNPIVVCADADLDVAVQAVHDGLFWNDGEACAAGSRVFVEDSIYPEFVKRSVELAAARKVGNPFDESAKQGAQVSEAQMHKILKYIEGAQAEGAKLETGGKRVGSKGNYIEPTVFSDVTDDMTIFKEEVFGPVLTLNKFSRADGLEAIAARANDSPYGLAAGIFTSDIKTGQFLAKKIRAGMVFMNCYHVVDVAAPFGGFKQSGYGREGGEYGLAPYMEVKMITSSIA
jgi:acyl-CoA reductase-like NAD-dependent aldehyde dehydrogenase